MKLLPRWLNYFRSLAANPAEYYALPEDERFAQWVAGAREMVHEFIARSHGKVLLDLGCGPLDRRSVAKTIQAARYVSVDVLPENQPDFVAAVDRLGLRSESVDSINCLSVLEHVFYPCETIAEIYRVLRPGGCVQVQVPFLLQYHGYPDDYFRYTHSALQRLFEAAGFRVVYLETDWSKGAYLNAAKMLEDGSSDIAKPRWRFITRVLAKALFWMNARVDQYYARSERGMYHALCLLAEKPFHQPQGSECHLNSLP